MARNSQRYRNERESGRSGGAGRTVVLAIVLALLLIALGCIIALEAEAEPVPTPTPAPPVETLPPTPPPTPSPSPTPVPYEPYSVESTDPSLLINSVGIEVAGEAVDSYEAEEKIYFPKASDYTDIKGISTFRGNNFRDTASYGTANLKDKTFTRDYWTVNTTSLQAPDGQNWFGSGWTGQPLIVEWPAETRKNMNMFDWAKEKDGLVEVILPCMDGYIYFMDLETGEKTRDAYNIGFTFKGTGTLDPRGYPLLYLGSGYESMKGDSRAFIISLIDGSVLYEYGYNDPFAIRDWSMYDGAPLVDAETDTLIAPGENGVIYFTKLNSDYNEAAGTVSIEPDTAVKWRYSAKRTTVMTYWLGMEASPVIYQGHLIIADNGGNLMCLDLETLQLVWVQDVLDDTNCTPVLELEDGHPYVYISTSFHAGWRAWENGTATVPCWKIDAVTGEVVWHKDYTCYTQSGVSGGVQGTPALGRNNVKDLIFFPVARCGDTASAGKLVALDKSTGEEVWCADTAMYSWGSPVLFYDDTGHGYIIYCTSGYYIYLFDALTGEKLDDMNIGGNVEASAAVYNDYVVVGTRAERICGIKMS